MWYSRLLCVLIAVLLWTGAAPGAEPVDRDKVEKVERIIERVSRAESPKNASELRIETVRENEINAYIAHLIREEKQKVLKSMQLTLGDANRVEGRAVFDLAGLKLGSFLPPEMHFDFEGDLETKDHKGRFNIRKLLLDKQPVKPEFLDVLFLAIASAYGAEPASIKDWHELPYGVHSIETSKGRALFYY